MWLGGLLNNKRVLSPKLRRTIGSSELACVVIRRPTHNNEKR